MDWEGKKVLVTGGASFIGSHLVDAMVGKGAKVTIVDNFSSGRIENISQHMKCDTIQLLVGNLLDRDKVREAVTHQEYIFHLAADHGGRGYVDTHQIECGSNFVLDGLLFQEAAKAGVKKVIYASSGCVYPNYLQTNPDEELYLDESKVGPPYEADNLYGWVKLMSEMMLRAYAKAGKFQAASCRYFTVYGPRGKEDHAVIAMIAKALIKQDPFKVWGDGQQIRNWTYVIDIVEGTIRIAEEIGDGTAVNLGTEERIRVIDAVRMVMEHTGHQAEVEFEMDKPVGPVNRVASNTLAKKLLAWCPKTKFEEGLKKTIDWYFEKNVGQEDRVRDIVEHRLLER